VPPLKVGRAAGRTAVLLWGWFFSTVAAPAAEVRMQRLDISGLPLVTCYFTVIDEKGDSLLGLVEGDFSVHVDGIPQRVLRLSSAMEGGRYLSVALLVDGSGSMRLHLERARTAATAFISHISRHDQIAIFSCDESLSRHMDFSSDRDLAVKALAAVRTRGNTALFDAVAEVLALFKGVSAPRRALVVLTDGRDNRSRSTVDENIRLARVGGVSLYAVGLGPASDDENLRRLAAGTGGEFFKAVAAADLLALYRKISEHLSNQYILDFDLSFAGDGRLHEVQLEYLAPEGERPALRRQFLASVSPTLAPSAVASMKSRVQRKRQYGQSLPGALLGLLSGLLLLAVLRLLRPAEPFLSWLGLALLGALVVLGALVGFLVP